MKVYPLSFTGLFFLLVLLGCTAEFEADLTAEVSQRTLNIRLTDAPINFEEVNIDIETVVVKGMGATDTLELNTNSGIYNLLEYQDGLDTLIANAVINMDFVGQVRLILGDSNTVKVDNEFFELEIPSGSQSGLKVKTCLDLTNVMDYDLVLDFDALESIHQTGNGRFIMNPVIHAVNPDAQCP